MMVMEGIALLGALAAGIAPQAGPELTRIATGPRVEIGASATDPNDQLFGVGPVLRAGEGGFLVVETSAGRIRFYDREGRFVRDLGGQGDGPGEFREILDAALLGDTLAVLDRDGSITRLGLDGTVIATVRFDPTGLTDERFNPVPFGILLDGRLLVRALERPAGRGRAPTDADLERFRERYLGRGQSANDRRVIAEWVDEAPVAERHPPFRRLETAGVDWILGVSTDALGVERVRLYGVEAFRE